MPYRPIAALFAAAVLLVAPQPAAAREVRAVLIGAGDIARCNRTQDDKVGAMIAARKGRVFTLGDNVQGQGTHREFRNCYHPAWGSFKKRTHPSPGNHEYLTPNAAGYFGYFGERAGHGYYVYRRGGWRIYSLNSELVDERQLGWLRAHLAANPTHCVLAYFHKPLFSSSVKGGDPAVRPFWDILHEAGADVILNGHSHSYERFAPQTPDGEASEVGIRQFVVGTGGAPQKELGTVVANSEVQQVGTYGALKLRLTPTGYTWEFLRAAGERFSDSGSGTCH